MKQFPEREKAIKGHDEIKQITSLINTLLEEGTDVHQEDRFMMYVGTRDYRGYSLTKPRSPYRLASKIYLLDGNIVERNPVFNRILSKGDPVEAFDFTDLHAATMNLDSSMTFKARLALTPREAINDLDAVGRTALSWAAELGDLDKIKTLLMKGADPNLADLSGKSALLWCAPESECLAALLNAGAHVDQVEKERSGTKVVALMRGPQTPNIIDCLEVLWNYKACLTYPQGSDRAIIHYAVQHDCPSILRWLLEKPIDLEARTTEGCTVLLHFLICNVGEHSNGLRILLDRKPNLHATDNMEQGVCHYMARWGSLTFLQVFQRQTGFTGLDVERRSLCGLDYLSRSIPGTTAMELAAWRRDRQSEWSLSSSMDLDPDPQAYFTAFEAWIDDIRATNPVRSSDAVEVDGKTFGGDGEGMETSTGSEQIAVADYVLRQRVPGSFPED